MGANGKHERQVTTLGTFSTFPDFSPDGGLLAFSSEPAGGGNTDLWIVPTDGGAPTQVTDTPDALEEYPVWSPDVTTILFVRITGDFSRWQLWTRDVATGLETQLTFDPTFKDQTPDWSPDGTRIAYGADDDIWVMDADGSGQDNLTKTPDVEFGTAFSPDGTRIAFIGSGGLVAPGQRYVQTINADGSGRQVVRATPRPRPGRPRLAAPRERSLTEPSRGARSCGSRTVVLRLRAGKGSGLRRAMGGQAPGGVHPRLRRPVGAWRQSDAGDPMSPRPAPSGEPCRVEVNANAFRNRRLVFERVPLDASGVFGEQVHGRIVTVPARTAIAGRSQHGPALPFARGTGGPRRRAPAPRTTRGRSPAR